MFINLHLYTKERYGFKKENQPTNINVHSILEWTKLEIEYEPVIRIIFKSRKGEFYLMYSESEDFEKNLNYILTTSLTRRMVDQL